MEHHQAASRELIKAPLEVVAIRGLEEAMEGMKVLEAHPAIIIRKNSQGLGQLWLECLVLLQVLVLLYLEQLAILEESKRTSLLLTLLIQANQSLLTATSNPAVAIKAHQALVTKDHQVSKETQELLTLRLLSSRPTKQPVS